jgi:hypothetical protein
MSEPDDAPQPANQPGRLERAGHAFANKPLYQGLTDISGAAIGLLAESVAPGASTVVPVATTGLRVATLAILSLYRKRADILNAEVASVAGFQPGDVLRREDFLHCYLATLQATIHTRREEKIRLFARLLVSTIKGADLADVDEYEEFLGILDEMSVREIVIVTILERFEREATKTPVPGEVPVYESRIAQGFWSEFITDIEEHAGVVYNERQAVLTRLNRTGLFAERPAMTPDFKGLEAMGHLTPRYYRLRQLIQDQQGNIIDPETRPEPTPSDAKPSP